VIGQHRSTQRKAPKDNADEQRLTADVIELAKRYGRYGYRKIHGLPQQAGWEISLSVVERIWRREGLKVPRKQPRRDRLWLNDGSCIRLRSERPGHVWSYDFVEDITHNGRKYRMLNIIDEYGRECLAMVPSDDSAPTTCSPSLPTCSSSMARRSTYDPSTTPSSRPEQFASGLARSA
jgi:transposase InsO family protein